MKTAAEDHGFSLIELLVVIAIISVLAMSVTLVLPRSDGGLNAAAISLERDVRALRLEAMMSGADRAIVPVANGWQAQAATPSGGWLLQFRRDFEGMTVRSTVPQFILRSDGSISEGALVMSDAVASTRCATREGGHVACRPA